MANGLVISCEHAANRVPPDIDLGVPDEILATHVAWDHGACAIAEGLGARLGARPFVGEWTRLFVDLNRFPENPAVIPTVAWGAPVPGNVDLSPEARQARLDRHHRPYREAVASAVASAVAGRGGCVHLSMHSFTPVLGDEVRDFDMGVLFDPDRHLDRVVAEALVTALNAAGLETRPNAPYPGWTEGLTTALRGVHGERVYAGIEIETSHRVTERAGGIEAVIAALEVAVPEVLGAR